MSDKKKTTRKSSGTKTSGGIVDQAQDVVREIAENVNEVVEEMRDDLRAVAEELGLKTPSGPGDGEPGKIGVQDDGRTTPHLPKEGRYGPPGSDIPTSGKKGQMWATGSPDEGRFDPAVIEQKWFERWKADANMYAAEDASSARKKYYVLEMLP